jgi:cytochrome b pre-mRNA-processing protein 3
MLGLFRRENPSRRAANALHDSIAARAREPIFHTRFYVADSIDGRFDLFTLHAFLVLDALKEEGAAGKGTGEQLANAIFAGFEEALRELGVGDMGISRRIRAMANAFYGRLAAYQAAGSEEELSDALLRNLYRGEKTRGDAARVLAHYIFAAQARLRSQDVNDGRIDFGPLPQELDKAIS